MARVIYRCGDWRVDPANRRLTRAGVELAPEAKVFGVLLMLLARAGALVTRDELLDAVWGHRHLTPATLNRVIALLRRAFDDDPENPRFIATVHGAGYRFIGAVERIEARDEPGRAHFGPPPVAQLPSKLEPLIGRERELGALRESLAQRRAVTVIGPGGMGKTQCALEVARECAADFPDGVWFFDVSPFARSEEWVRAFAVTLAVPTAGARVLPRIVDALRERKALLVLDNCDRLATELGALVFELLRSCRDLKVLATSQQRLDFVGESLMWLPTLKLPPAAAEARSVALDALAANPSVALLLERARAIQPTAALDRGNAGDIVEICRHVDGLPLALELAAAQFATLPPAAIRERLNGHFSLLASGSAGREPRHQTMHALVEWSFGLLDEGEQRLLCWLAVFLQGWTIDALESIGAHWTNEVELLALHSALVFKSLIVVDPTLAPARYRMLEPVRELALERLRAAGDEARARRAHLDHFVRLADRSHRGILAKHVDEWIGRLRHEHANIDAALTWAKSAAGDDEAALALAGSLLLYCKCSALVWLPSDWGERALEGVAPKPTTTYVRALLASGVSKLYVQNPAAEPHLALAAELADAIGDRWAQTCANAYLALWNAHLARRERAKAHAALAADLAGHERDEWLRSIVGWAKAWIALASGNHEKVLATLQPLRHVSFDPQQHQMTGIYLGLSHYALGHWSDAARSLLAAMDSSLRTRGLRSTSAGVEIAALLAMRSARFEACARWLGKAADIRERTRAPLFSFWVEHHDEAASRARRALGSDVFERTQRAGATSRDEVVVDEARRFLHDVAAGVAAPLAQSVSSTLRI